MKRSRGASRPTNMVACLLIILTLYVATSPVHVAGQEEARVAGRVVNEDGQELGDVEVEVYSSEGALVTSEYTDSDGDFRVYLQVNNTYTLHFSKSGYAKATKSIYLGDERIDLEDIVLLKALRMSSSVLSQVANPGDRLMLPFTVSNIGEEPEVVEFSVSRPEGWSTRILMDQTSEITKVYLLDGASLSLQLEAIIPLTSTGNNSLSLTAAGKTSSTLNFTIIVEPSEKSIIFCQFPGKSAAPGETIPFQVRVKNPFGVEMLFRVAVDSAPPDWTAFVKSAGGEIVTELALDSGEFTDLIVEVHVPTETPDGEYDVIFKASSLATSEDIALLVVVQKLAAGIGVDLEAIPPYLDAYAGSQAKFRLKVKNGGGYDQLFDLDTRGLPPELRAWFEGPDEQEITRLYVEAGELKEFYVVVALPKEAALGTLDFTVSVASVSVTKSLELTLNVLGFYEITVTNVNFYTRVSVGGETSYELRVKNTGTHDATNVRVDVAGSIPDGFTVDIDPTVYSSLRPDEEAVFIITVKTQSDVNAGNYYVDLQVRSDQTEAFGFTLRIEAEQEMSWVFIGGALVVVALVALFFIYRKFGRR
ncbi:MAG: NEW3 domain-containing protein [Candidatus Bathyarchaeia archaeon]